LIKVIWDKGFKKIYRKKVKNDSELKERFWAGMQLFSKDPFDRRLRTHKLSGKLEGLWALSVGYDCRVVFKFLGNDEVLLVDIGSHDEVY
jgi:addiction module RelE/StbE family toxin